MGRGSAVIRALALSFALGAAATAGAQVPADDIAARVERVGPKVVDWRRDIHRNPELGNRETRTAGLVAQHLRRLGMEVRTGVAATGVIGVLRGGRPGPVVALRADMDALPVEERTGLPYASRVKTQYNGQTTFVAHACGHDAHVAMLMGAAEVLAGMRAQLPGTVVFVFQPAEEGPPAGETGGAARMVAEGALRDPAPSAMFGIHVTPGPVGAISYRPEGFMAAADSFEIKLSGRQTHGAMPWRGIDLASLSAAIVNEFNMLAARTVDVTRTPTILTVATIHGGVRWNIIPEEMTLTGTLRTFEEAQRNEIKARMQKSLAALAESYGARAALTFDEGAAVTSNHAALTAWALPAMQEAAGRANVDPGAVPVTGAEDFSYFQRALPGLFVHLGASPDGMTAADSPPNHSPFFTTNEAALPVGVRAHVTFAVRYLESGGIR